MGGGASRHRSRPKAPDAAELEQALDWEFASDTSVIFHFLDVDGSGQIDMDEMARSRLAPYHHDRSQNETSTDHGGGFYSN